MSQKSNQTASQRGINSYFKPKPFSNPCVTPAKRRSPALEDEDANTIRVASNGNKPRTEPQLPKTPSTASRFKDVETLTPKRSPAGFPPSGTPLQVPFRSPRPSQTARRCSSVSDLSSVPSSLPSSFPTVKPKLKPKPKPKPEPVTKPEREEVLVNWPPLSSTDLSFASLPRSSQKVVYKGRTVAVRGSDEEDEDSDSSLEDLDDLLGKTKEPVTSSSSPPSIDEQETAYGIQSWIGIPPKKKRDPIVGKEVFSSFRTVEPKYKHALDSLLAHHLDSEEVESNVEKLRKQYEIDERAEKARKLGEMGKNLDSTLLESVTQDGKEGESVSISRLMEAVKRTEALNGEKTWSFFQADPCHGSVHYENDFPRTSLRNAWEQSLKGRDTRQRSFLSGYLVEYWKDQEISPELVRWMLSAIASEPDDQLREMYARTVCSTSPAALPKAIDPAEIQRVLSLFGISVDCQECCSDSLRPNRSIRDPYPDPDWRYLISVVETLAGLSQHFSIQARSTLAIQVCRMALDSILMSNLQMSLTVEDAISRLLDVAIDEHSAMDFLIDLHEALYTTIQVPALQAQLLRHILPTSDCASRFRVRLAHSFLFQAFPPIDDFAKVTIDLDTFANHLENPRYDIIHHMRIMSFDRKGEEYDYGSLASWAQILDIAIDNGVGTSTQPDSQQSPKERSTAFNAQVDNLADKVKAIATSIRDTGASHMKRTEAKSALDMLYFRLIHAVRTTPRPKRAMFGEARAQMEKQKGKAFMDKFFGKTD